MDRMWAPWRKKYIRFTTLKTRGCLFCRLGRDAKSRDAKNYILKRSKHNYAVLNLYPYNNGHTLIIPFRHVARVEQMTDDEKLDWLQLYEEVQAGLKKTLKPQGFNIGMNLGRIAGAGIPKHAHLHIVPRWKGDMNFMPVIGETKIISESLDSAYQILSRALRQTTKSPRLAKR